MLRHTSPRIRPASDSRPNKPCTVPCCAPRQVKILTNHLPCGQEVSIDLEPAASKAEIKAKLQEATGVPAAHQKLLLSGINQIVMGDKRWVGGWVVGAWGAVCSQLVARIPEPSIATRPAPPCRTNIGYSACGSANGVQMAVNSKQ